MRRAERVLELVDPLSVGCRFNGQSFHLFFQDPRRGGLFRQLLLKRGNVHPRGIKLGYKMDRLFCRYRSHNGKRAGELRVLILPDVLLTRFVGESHFECICSKREHCKRGVGMVNGLLTRAVAAKIMLEIARLRPTTSPAGSAAPGHILAWRTRLLTLPDQLAPVSSSVCARLRENVPASIAAMAVSSAVCAVSLSIP